MYEIPEALKVKPVVGKEVTSNTIINEIECPPTLTNKQELSKEELKAKAKEMKLLMKAFLSN